MKESVPAKAHRLSSDVTPVKADVFYVKGDHGIYFVIVGQGARFCSCKAGWQAFEKGLTPECSHIGAAVRWLMRQRIPKDLDPFEGLAGKTRGDGHR